jgi:DNA repair protein RecO
MSTFKDLVYILTTVPYRDADYIVNLLSRENGKISAVIYGGRKIGKPSSFPFHAGDLVEMEYKKNENREFVTVVNVSGTSGKPDDFSYEQFVFHSYLIEILGKISRPGLPSDDLFDILGNYNTYLSKGALNLSFISWVLWQLIKSSGYQIDYSVCSSCHQETWKIIGKESPSFRKQVYYLLPETGNIICKDCRDFSISSYEILPAMLKIIWLFETSSDYGKVFDDLPSAYMAPLAVILNQYMLNRFEISPKSLSSFKELLDSFSKS